MIASRYAAAAALILALSTSGASARSQFPAEDRSTWFNGGLPLCDDWVVQQEIAWRFGHREWRFTDSHLGLSEFRSAGETAYRPYGKDLVPRRYCVGRALFSDGVEREVKYNLFENGGFLGIGRGVEYCVVGLDREHAYSPDCQAAGQ